jgi:ABC-type bacteriocin/lantibiotic exporter with double-glycine peptidase domain
MIIRYCMILGLLALLSVAFLQQQRMEATVSAGKREAQTEPHCGPAALYLICRAEDIPASFAELKQQVSLTKRGTSLLSLKTAAQNVGLQAQGIQSSFAQLQASLKQSSGRAILHLPKRQHFVAVLSSTPDTLCVVDPTHGCACWDASRLAQEGWTGHALLITKQ